MDRYDIMQIEGSIEEYSLFSKDSFLFMGANENPREFFLNIRLRGEVDPVDLLSTVFDFLSIDYQSIEEIEHGIRKETFKPSQENLQ